MVVALILDFLSKKFLILGATSNFERIQILDKVEKHPKAEIYMRDDKFSVSSSKSNLYPNKGIRCVFYFDILFISYGCALPRNFVQILEIGHRKRFYSEYQIHKKDFEPLIVQITLILCFCFNALGKSGVQIIL